MTFTDSNGVALVGGCVFSYAGGTSTPLATYTDSTIGTPNANPVILDATGSANIWLGPSTYKFAIWSFGGTNCSSGALQWTVDQVPGNTFNNATFSGGAWSGGTITGAAVSGGTISGAAITASTIDGSCVGCTTPAAGAFTSLSSAVNNMAFSATPSFNATSYGYFSMTLTGNAIALPISGGQTGQQVAFDICQDVTGGRTFAWPANLQGPPPVNPIASSCTVVVAFYDAGFWNVVVSTPQILFGNFNTVASAVTPVFAAASYSNFYMALTASVSSSTITGGVTGQVITIRLCQDSSGGHTVTWPSNLNNVPTLASAANACTSAIAVYDGTTWQTVSSWNYPAVASGAGTQSTVLASAFNTSSTSLVSTGLVLPSIAAATTVRGTCNLVWSQGTALSSVTFGVGTSTAPSSMTVFAEGQIFTSTTITSYSGTTPTSVGTVTPGGINTPYTQRLNFTLTTGASADVVTIYGNTASAADGLTIYQGSSCGWLP